MRIMQVVARFHAGGSEQVVVNLATGLARRGHDLCVVAITSARRPDAVGEAQKRRLTDAGIEVVEFAGEHFRLNLFTGALRLAALWRRWRPDIVHSHTDRPDFAVSLARRLTPVPIARTIHNSQLWHTHWWPGRLAETGFRDDLVILISDAARRAYGDLRRRYGLDESAVQATIPNGIPTIAPAERAMRDELARLGPIGADRVPLCFAGRFTPQKGFDVLLDALERLPPDILARIELHAFGDGEMKETCAARVRRAGLPVRFHAPVAGIARLFPAFDALVVPSRFEGLPLVALEGLAAGVPVVATRAPGLEEALPPDWPLAVPTEDPEALAALLARIASNGVDALSLRDRAAAWMRGRFSVDAMVDAYDAAYRQYLAARTSPTSLARQGAGDRPGAAGA